MKANKRLIIIIGIIVAIIVGFMAFVFEVRDVPDYNWYKKYKYDSKEPYGLWMFSELIKTKYDSSNVIFNESDSLYLPEGNNQLYIVVGDDASYTNDQNNKLIDFIKNGNSALIIASNTNLKVPLDSFYAQKLYLIEDQEYDRLYDHSIIDENGDTTYIIDDYYNENQFIDTTDTENLIGDTIVETNNYSDSYYDDPTDSILFLSRYIENPYDSIIYFDKEPFDSIYSDYLYKHYHPELKKLAGTGYNSLHKIPELRAQSINYKELLYTTDTSTFFAKMQLEKGELYLHTIPMLTTNIGTRQEYYLDHFNFILSHFDPEKIIIDKTRINFNFFNDDIKKSPIAFILKTPSLAWAYYLLIASLLCFVIFRSKRLQRIIPLTEKNENTSLQYIKTLSTLYLSHQQNNKLVIHMRDVFYNKIKSKYFLDPTVSGYVKQLSKKTKISEKEISTLLHKFESANNSNFTDEQLIVLHNQIESFHKKSK